ncbi:hypothetical protein HanLR1_Chr17g0678251 [Helianthus annuus]|nr:hypothetical protein HanLR1_Chr17g0678251 [Helianthus annuus]
MDRIAWSIEQQVRLNGLFDRLESPFEHPVRSAGRLDRLVHSSGLFLPRMCLCMMV